MNRRYATPSSTKVPLRTIKVWSIENFQRTRENGCGRRIVWPLEEWFDWFLRKIEYRYSILEEIRLFTACREIFLYVWCLIFYSVLSFRKIWRYSEIDTSVVVTLYKQLISQTVEGSSHKNKNLGGKKLKKEISLASLIAQACVRKLIRSYSDRTWDVRENTDTVYKLHDIL